ncbi:hypothetical protein ABVK25_011042 [Lepraria finkii]|uniref:Major facilitator superfamily (MFS) profile domain-containing protein n=1 Tax=Lepraria finkii TaxID=1340010 RepID=A0ABR4ASQ0_9LECA
MTRTQTTAIELEPQTVESTTNLQRDAAFNSSDQDSILQASRVSDSTVPDGGYGWAVVFGCSAMTFWFVGTTYSWGILQASLLQQNLSSASTLSFVGSVTAASISFLAIVNARVIRLLGARTTALLGMTLLALGEILAGFCTHNIGALFFTAGIIMGIGVSLAFMVVSVTPAQYFNKKRGLANGIVYAGGGLGGTIITLVMNSVIEKVGPAWTFRILGLATLGTGLPAAWLIKERSPIRTATFVEWRLFRDFKFVVLFIAGAVATFPLFVPPFFLPLYSNSLGLSSNAGAGLVAGFNFSSAVGRLICGLAADKLGPLNSLFMSLLLSAASMLVIWPVSNSLGPLIIFVGINGAANGGFFATMPTVVGTVFGSARVSVAMGMIVTGWAGGYLMGAPIAGYLLEAYGGEHSTLMAYHPAMFYAGSMALGASGMVGLVRLYISKSLLKKL